jgi:multicomponent Na+:H+ antiporter subunit G
VIDVVIDVLLAIGTFFVAVAAIGIHRLDDVYGRLQASAKAGTLGLVAVLLASALYFAERGVFATKEVLTILFLFLTVPVGAHLISTAAYRLRAPIWDRTVVDEAAAHIPVRDDEPDTAHESADLRDNGRSGG